MSIASAPPQTCTSLHRTPNNALVHANPRNSSHSICISSITTTSKSSSKLASSTVDDRCVENGTFLCSCPVSSSVYIPSAVRFSYVSAASNRSGARYIPFSALFRRCSASYVLPELVGPAWKMILRLSSRARGYHSCGFVRSVCVANCRYLSKSSWRSAMYSARAGATYGATFVRMALVVDSNSAWVMGRFSPLISDSTASTFFARLAAAALAFLTLFPCFSRSKLSVLDLDSARILFKASVISFSILSSSSTSDSSK
mmetsp:Transcript_31029/g.67109  ORF Transcript_31029/g.67109 Transcript_31029/m.67109 type:complete len:258 (-) Transcript_31029:353-1126(-)